MFPQRDFKVLVTLEALGAAEVAGALAMMIERIGVPVVRHDAPRLAGARL